MSNVETWLIIILIIAVIASNLVVLKYSAKYKLPQFGKNNKKVPRSTQKKPAANDQHHDDPTKNKGNNDKSPK
ncbi:DUF2897 family protein [Shewanella surugensis]|uniref:DUF2897 family protein n=1 Tax=Shewanella surugensis TaxID=212020 RepID=A0ABT0LDS6_9GAMM|nr:DUF2897 family protein [Shewanella surugensis]MCL1125487.1 DUF2897 family protein [Shewanella surugensis]